MRANQHVRRLEGIAAGLSGVAVVVFVLGRILSVNASTAGFFFLLVVLAVATARGFAAAAVVSVAATLSYNYFFLPPVGLFSISDPENWVALFTFLLTALVSSHLSDQARRQAEDARRSQQETEQLYALSRAILLTDATRPIGPQAAQSIAQIFASSLVAVFDAKSHSLFRGGPEEVDEAALERVMRETVRVGARQHEASLGGLDVWPIALGGGSPIGALAMRGMQASDGAVQSILNLVAIALERVRTEEAASRAEIARQSEEFKSTLLDAIAHEFQTPLTSIKASATGLRMVDGADQRELISIIEEETDRLSHLVTEAVKMAEIDAGKITLRRAPVAIADVLRDAAATFAGRGDERISVEAACDESLFWDAELLVLALRQLIDNALKYSGHGSPVVCRAERAGDRVMLQVIDRGPGIPERERERIFEKYYRRSAVRSMLPGTGLGLYIAREIARIHGGDLWVEPGSPDGSVFCLALPASRQEGAS